MRNLPPGYALSASQLDECILQMHHLPVTFEHLGIEAASKQIAGAIDHAQVATVLKHAPAAAHRSFGRVVDAWKVPDGGCWATIEMVPLPGMAWMIESGLTQSCSLTHWVDGAGCVRPLELSLVSNPARPHCQIRHTTVEPRLATAYKASTLDGSITTMNVAPTLLAPTSCADVIDRMEPGPARELIVARLQHLTSAAVFANNKASTAETKSGTLEEELKTRQWQTDTDYALLASQIETLLGQMTDETKKNFSVTVPDTLKAFEKGDAKAIAQASLRTIMCANHHMMMMSRGDQHEPKRTRTEPVVYEAPRTTTAVHAPADVSMSTNSAPLTQEEILRNALTLEFEVGP
jgi:hypothetical protein